MTHSIGHFFTPERVGGGCYFFTSMMVALPFDALIDSLRDRCFTKKTPIPESKPTLHLLDQFNIRKISTKSELLERIFMITLSLLTFIPTTIITKNLLSATRFAGIEVIKTPLLHLFQKEVIYVVRMELLIQGLLLIAMQEPIQH